MVTYAELNGFQEFEKYADGLDPKGPPALFYFTGSKLPNGDSWCPDCVEAEPVVKSFLSEVKRDIIFVSVNVGDKDVLKNNHCWMEASPNDCHNDQYGWRDKACPFRTDSRLKLMVIPTLIMWKGVKRLEGSQCAKRELLQMLFEEEE